MRYRRIAVIPPMAALFLICAVRADEPARPYAFFTIDVPTSLSTTVFGINSNRDIVGAYETPFPPEFGLPPSFKWFHGFVMRNGKLTTIDAPGAILTQIRGINAEGDIVGTFIPIQNASVAGGGFRGLLMRNGGPLITIDYRTFPRAHLNTILMRIASDGTMVGCYHDEGIDSGPQDSMHGITIDKNGASTAIDDEVRGVQFGGGMHTGTTANGTKKVGFWWDHSIDRSRGYEIEKGKFVPFDVPGGRYTQAWDVGASGDVVGFYGDGDVIADPTLHARGFLKIGDSFQSIAYPKSIDTRAFGINPAGDIVGTYQTADGHTHGFVALQVKGLSVEGSVALKLPAGMRTGTTIAALKPIDKSARLAKPAGEDPACHRVPLKAAPVTAVAPKVTDSHGF